MNKNLLLAFVGIGIGGITFGLLTPVTVVLFERNNTPGIITGIITTINYVPFVLFSTWIGQYVEKHGIKIVMLGGLISLIVGSLGHIFWNNLYILIPVRFITGIGSTAIFVATEILINLESDTTNRGKNIGLYVILLSLGIAFGTMLVWTVELADWLPFVVGALVMIFVLILQSAFMDTKTSLIIESCREKMPLSKMPTMSMLSAFIFGVFEASVFVAVPIFGLRSFFSTSEVSTFLTSFVAGGIIILYFISKLSDTVSKFNLLLFVSVILGALFLTPIITNQFYVLLIAFFIIGGLVPSYYTIGLNLTMEIVESKYIAQSNGHFIMMYGVGTLLGPMFGAMLVDFSSHYGYWLFSSTLCFLFFLYFIITKRSRQILPD